MAKRHTFLPLLGLLLLLVGCQTVENVSIDYLVPAEISFPAGLRRVAIVNNVPTTEIAEDLSEGVRLLGGDGKAAAESLAEAIAAEEYFDEVLICDSALRATDAEPRGTLLRPEEVEQLADELDADFLIALEDVRLQATRHATYSPAYGFYFAHIDLVVTPVLRVYLPGRQRPLLTLQSSDSIYWEKAGPNKEFSIQRLPDEKEVIEQGSQFAGTVPIARLLPTWKHADRRLFGGGSVNMRDAAVLAREGRWSEAIPLWKEVYQKKKGKQKMCAAYNLALGHEMHDDLNTAYDWIIKAQEEAARIDKVDEAGKDGTLDLNTLPHCLITSLYMSELEERKAAMGRLHSQMQRFNEE